MAKDNLEREGKLMTEEEESALKQPILEKYEKESHSFYSSARLWDDGVIQPKHTREVLSLALQSTISYVDPASFRTKFGVFRM